MSDFSFSVIIENVNCYSSGIICRKFISINVGNSLIIFEDDSGNPVRPGARQGWRDNQSVGKWAESKEGCGPDHRNFFLSTVELSQWLNLLVVRVRNTEINIRATGTQRSMREAENLGRSWGWPATWNLVVWTQCQVMLRSQQWPFLSPQSPESFLDKKQEVHTWRAGFFTLVHFPREHITLLWDQQTTVHIQAGPQWQVVVVTVWPLAGHATLSGASIFAWTISALKIQEHHVLCLPPAPLTALFPPMLLFHLQTVTLGGPSGPIAATRVMINSLPVIHP